MDLMLQQRIWKWCIASSKSPSRISTYCWWSILMFSLSAVCIRSQKKCWCMKMNLNGGLSENIEGISRAIRRSRCDPRKLKSHKAVQVEFGNESNVHHFRLLNMHSPQQFNTKVKKRKHRKKIRSKFQRTYWSKWINQLKLFIIITIFGSK